MVCRFFRLFGGHQSKITIAQSFFSRASFEPAVSLFWPPDPQISSPRIRKHAMTSFPTSSSVVWA
jgi:hypothetical protein